MFKSIAILAALSAVALVACAPAATAQAPRRVTTAEAALSVLGVYCRDMVVQPRPGGGERVHCMNGPTYDVVREDKLYIVTKYNPRTGKFETP